MEILLDFDGTVVEHQWPNMGRCNFGCMEIIKKLQDAGHTIILNTYRAECNDGTLQKALDLFEKAWMVTHPRNYDFELKPITHSKNKIHPPQFDVEEFIKSGVFFIDDQCHGTPLKKAAMSNGWMVNWDEMDSIFKANGMY
jgi:hypothetical protein